MSQVYKHYKGDLYRLLITDAEIESAPGDPHVVYVSLKDGRVWVRPHDDFFDDVNYNGVKTKRFTPQ